MRVSLNLIKFRRDVGPDRIRNRAGNSRLVPRDNLKFAKWCLNPAEAHLGFIQIPLLSLFSKSLSLFPRNIYYDFGATSSSSVMYILTDSVLKVTLKKNVNRRTKLGSWGQKWEERRGQYLQWFPTWSSSPAASCHWPGTPGHCPPQQMGSSPAPRLEVNGQWCQISLMFRVYKNGTEWNRGCGAL